MSYYRGDGEYGPSTEELQQSVGSGVLPPGFIAEGPYVRPAGTPSPYGSGLPPWQLVLSLLAPGLLAAAGATQAGKIAENVASAAGNLAEEVLRPITAVTTTEPGAITTEPGATSGAPSPEQQAILQALQEVSSRLQQQASQQTSFPGISPPDLRPFPLATSRSLRRAAPRRHSPPVSRQQRKLLLAEVHRQLQQ